MTELDVARAIAAGTLTSPTEYFNASFFAMRISGTGAAYRAQYKEIAFRDPKIWLAPEMIDRVRGLPVIWVHPDAAMLDTEEFANRIIGTITLAYVQADELWGIARILDADAATLLREGEFDTSPSAIYSPGEGQKLRVGEETILVEGNPALVDHIAVVAEGLWSKGKPDNAGVSLEIAT
ncbi:MAG TPA: DUF2213 domain-containing protein [Rhizomicrobium sp.]|jgi:hypothetical protein|nr:DUF2213 domain-containing protein [Rhizomicrobium sp.]